MDTSYSSQNYGPVLYQVKTKSGNEDIWQYRKFWRFVWWLEICPSSPLVPNQTPVESHTTPTSTGGTLCRSKRVHGPVTTYAPMVSN